MFACQQEDVIPDFLCLAKGLTGGYLPMAATLTTERVFEGFNGVDKTFYYGHSYTANQLGCAAALASLDVFEEEQTLQRLDQKIEHLRHELQSLSGKPMVHDVRQCGLIAGVEIKSQSATEGWGAKICLQARRHGLLTRPIGDTVVLMPPLSSSLEEISQMVDALSRSLNEVS
jgi:adenosylmethionine-8-amino-7-oxononanoate aminotransferase